MSPRRFRSRAAAAALLLALSQAPAAQAGSWTFTQTGWRLGQTATLNFSGTDTSGDGVLSLTELTAFSLDHDAVNPASDFVRGFTLSDLSAFDWDMGDSLTFGDDAIDSLYAEYLHGGYVNRFSAQVDPIDGFSARYFVNPSEMRDTATPWFTATTPVPEPATAALLGTGLAALTLRRRSARR